MNRPSAGAGPWGGPALLVPISVDALLLTSPSYDLLWSWITPEYRTVRLFLPPAALPFAARTPVPLDPAGNPIVNGTGAVLRWALPDALTAGGTVDPASGAVAFPSAPNRWLVLRRVTGQPDLTRQWILASDYLGVWPVGSGQANGSPYLVGQKPTTIGMCWEADAWPGDIALPAGPNPPLTAIGVGNPTFAAYVPNTQHAFSFYDPLADVASGTVAYTVCGWHAGAATGPLEAPATRQTVDDWDRAMSALGWSVGDHPDVAVDAGERWAAAHGFTTDPNDPRTFLPARTVYHALVCGVSWQGAADPRPPSVYSGVPTVTADPNTTPSVTLAHTASDAVAAVVGAATSTATPAAEVLTAILADLLPLLDEADGADQLALRLQDTWFQPLPGGTSWQLVDPASGQGLAPALTATQAQQLDAVNAAQQALDSAARTLAALQTDLYFLWWKQQYVSATGPPYPITDAPTVLDQLLTAKQAQVTDALTAWRAGRDQRDAARQQLGDGAPGLQLREAPLPPFLRPTDPVLLVGGVGRSYAHGQDGRFSDDGSVYCRFTGQTLATLQVAGTASTVDAATLGLPALSLPDVPAEVADLVVETFLLDPFNAHAIAQAADPTNPPPDAVVAAQQTLVWNVPTSPLEQQTVAEQAGLGSDFDAVAVPSKIAVEYWSDLGSPASTHPPWAPLFLDWSVRYCPSPNGTADWAFPNPAPQTPLDAQTAAWVGAQPTAEHQIQGRTLLTPQAAEGFAARLAQLIDHFGDAPELAPYRDDLNDALTYLQNACVLSQSLSGFTDQLLHRDPRRFVPPVNPDMTPALGSWLSPPDGPAFVPTTAPAPDVSVPFTPFQAGFIKIDIQRAGVELDNVWVIDDFGQTYDVLADLLAHPELGGLALGPDLAPSPGAGLGLLRPRILQPSRLQLRFLDALDDTKIVGLASAAAPICGWLLPNRLDDGILVYDAAGILQGELLLTPDAALWLPSPDLAPPKAQTAAPNLANPHLAALVNGVLGGSAGPGPLGDLLAVIQKAAWATDAASPSSPQLSALLGLPLAVARVQLLLELAGTPATDQAWAKTGHDDDGGISEATFPLRLGADDLDDDGLVGFLTDADPAHLATPYAPSTNGYATAPVVSAQIGQSRVVTAILHPQARVHAFSGILPPVSAALPPLDQQAPLSAMEVTFRGGPLLTPPTAVTAPLPAYGRGDWSWLQYDSPTQPARTRALVAANDAATLLDLPPLLREGWLRLQLVPPPTVLRYTVSPTAVIAGGTLAATTTLTITAGNASGAPVTVRSITLTLPVGTDPDALTAAPDLIVASVQPGSWTILPDPTRPGTFQAAPVDPATPIDPGATLTVTLADVTVDASPGPATLTITEITEVTGTAAPRQEQVELLVEKVPLPAWET